MANEATVFTDYVTLSTVCDHIRNIANLQVFGGCTQKYTLPENSLTIRKVQELSQTEKKERYIEFGPGVTLSYILSLGRANVPTVLYDAIETIGTTSIRNIATIGGNICASLSENEYKQTLWAPLLALGAMLEIKTVKNTNKTGITQIPFSQFTQLPKDTILTKIKVPLTDWEISIFRRVGPSNNITDTSASFVFLADTQKDILTDLRITFAGPLSFNLRDIINQHLSGIKLPIKQKQLSAFIEKASIEYDSKIGEAKVNPVLKAQFLNLLRFSFIDLTEPTL